MEDTLRGRTQITPLMWFHVLILVLMEDTLRAYWRLWIVYNSSSLNPCFNGRYSQRMKRQRTTNSKSVLILVLMEDTLRAIKVIAKEYNMSVLILVLMEDTLREKQGKAMVSSIES